MRNCKKKYKPVKIRWTVMSEKMADSPDYASKLERDSEFIASLMVEGEKQAEKFLNSTVS